MLRSEYINLGLSIILIFVLSGCVAFDKRYMEQNYDGQGRPISLEKQQWNCSDKHCKWDDKTKICDCSNLLKEMSFAKKVLGTFAVILTVVTLQILLIEEMHRAHEPFTFSLL